MKLVVDANVAMKWILSERKGELHVDQAFALLSAIGDGDCEIFQPPHFRAEVVAVVTRPDPIKLDLCLGLLEGLYRNASDTTAHFRRAGLLAVKHRHHLYDTLYHAVALEDGATFVTADEVYFAKAKDEGAIMRLADFKAPGAA